MKALLSDIKKATIGRYVILRVLATTFHEWKQDRAPRLGAALAFYSMFSLAPLLIIAVAISGAVFGQEAAQGQILEEAKGLVGPDAAKSIEEMILNSAEEPETSVIASIIGVITLLLGASGVFGQLQQALNTIWDAPPRKKRTFWFMLRDRFVSFAMVLVLGFLLLVSLVISAALTALSSSLNERLPFPPALMHGVEFMISFAVVTIIFGLIYKVLPDVMIQWNDVWVGAAMTSLLFTTGKYLIGLYLGKSSVASAYGAAGSLVILLLWVYYSAQILLFGAEFTHVYATRNVRQRKVP